MGTDVLVGGSGGEQLVSHPLRAAILGEVHARPFTPVETPCRVLHFAFDTSGERAQADRAALVGFCAQRGVEPLAPADKQHRVVFSGTAMRWEQHSEFTTYTWELPSAKPAPDAAPFDPPASTLAGPMASVPQPGPLLVALDLHLLTEAGGAIAPERIFDRNSIAVAENSDGLALFATDWWPRSAITWSACVAI